MDTAPEVESSEVWLPTLPEVESSESSSPSPLDPDVDIERFQSPHHRLRYSEGVIIADSTIPKASSSAVAASGTTPPLSRVPVTPRAPWDSVPRADFEKLQSDFNNLKADFDAFKNKHILRLSMRKRTLKLARLRRKAYAKKSRSSRD